MLLTRHGFLLRTADYAILVFRWRVYCVESKVRTLRRIDHVMLSARRDDNALTVLDAVFYAVNNHFSFSCFKSKELIPIWMCFFAYLFRRFESHEHELAVFARVEYTTK